MISFAILSPREEERVAFSNREVSLTSVLKGAG
jgi:hypothetical protein